MRCILINFQLEHLLTLNASAGIIDICSPPIAWPFHESCSNEIHHQNGFHYHSSLLMNPAKFEKGIVFAKKTEQIDHMFLGIQ